MYTPSFLRLEENTPALLPGCTGRGGAALCASAGCQMCCPSASCRLAAELFFCSSDPGSLLALRGKAFQALVQKVLFPFLWKKSSK